MALSISGITDVSDKPTVYVFREAIKTVLKNHSCTASNKNAATQLRASNLACGPTSRESHDKEPLHPSQKLMDPNLCFLPMAVFCGHLALVHVSVPLSTLNQSALSRSRAEALHLLVVLVQEA